MEKAVISRWHVYSSLGWLPRGAWGLTSGGSVHHHDADHAPRSRVGGRGGAHHVARLSPVAGRGDRDISSRPGSSPATAPALSQDVQRGPEGDPVPLEEEHGGQHQDGHDGHPDGDEDGDGAEAPGGVVAQPAAPLVLVDQKPAVLRGEKYFNR